MKSALVIGLGRFGRHMAMALAQHGNDVLAVDKNEERVNDIIQYVADAQIGDATNENFISSIGARNFDICIVAIGSNFQSSLEATDLLKENGAKFVLARANRDVHKKFLLRNGADEVVYAEREMAERLAVKYGTDNVFDYIELTPEYAIYEIKTPDAWIGKTIIGKAVRMKHHVSILATKKDGMLNPLPKPEHIFEKDETLIVMGHNDDVLTLTK